MSSFLPTSLGWLAYWQLVVSVAAVFNTIQNFVTIKLTQRVYNNVPADSVTTLQARTFAAWTMTSALIRFYAAYNINNKIAYDLAFISYLIAFGHFSSEILIFRSCRLMPGAISPVIVSTSSLIWMFFQYDFYVRS